MALSLASVGLYGIMAYSVNQRRREIGVRMALGADRESVSLLVLRQGMAVVLSGVAVGVALAFLLGRVLSRFLYGVSGNDLISIASASLVLLLVALVACYLPRSERESSRSPGRFAGSVKRAPTHCSLTKRKGHGSERIWQHGTHAVWKFARNAQGSGYRTLDRRIRHLPASGDWREGYPKVPPSIPILAAIGLVVYSTSRWAWTAMLGLVLTVLIWVGVFATPGTAYRLHHMEDLGPLIGTLVQLMGLALVAGIATVIMWFRSRNREAASQR